MNQTDLNPELLRPYDPRHMPLPAPSVDVCAGPVVSICVNVEWWAHISGMIGRLTYRDAWAGNDDQISDAIQSIYKILNVGRPTMGCGCGDSGLPSQYSSDGVFQVSYDGGVTWVDAPELDPRNNVTLLPITVTGTGDEKKCKAANSAVAYLQQMEADTHARKQAGATIAAIAEAVIAFLVVVGIIATGGALAVLGGALAAIAANATAADFDAAFTSSVWADLLCEIYCALDGDLNITDAKWNQISSQIKAAHPGIAGDYLSGAINMMGAKGLINATRLGLNAGLSCDSCPSCEPGCDNEWHVYTDGGPYFGEILEQTPTHIIAQTTNINTNGVWYIYLITDDINTCCYVNSMEILEGTDVGFIASDCGNAIGTGLGNKTEGCYNQLQPQSNGPFKVKFNIDACP